MADAPLTAAQIRCVLRDANFVFGGAGLVPLAAVRERFEEALAATPSPPVAAAPASPVVPTEWGISPFLSRATPVPTRPWFERIWREVNLNDMPYSGSSLLRFAHAVFDAASRTAQPQPQPAQPLTGAVQPEVVGLFSVGADDDLCFHHGNRDPASLCDTLNDNVTGGPYRARLAYAGPVIERGSNG